MKIYNTLTKKKEEFEPLEKNKVKMYVCGPTVYNLIHIGNARPMICFDTVRRYLEYKGYEVNYVSNFTDVDDKIIKKANEEGVTATEIAERYIKECKQDMEALNIKPATHQPRATEEIGGMIKMIQTLIKKGHAYEVDRTVYFIFKINIIIQMIAFDRNGRCLSCFFFQFMEFVLFDLYISIGFLNRFIKHIQQ